MSLTLQFCWFVILLWCIFYILFPLFTLVMFICSCTSLAFQQRKKKRENKKNEFISMINKALPSQSLTDNYDRQPYFEVLVSFKQFFFFKLTSNQTRVRFVNVQILSNLFPQPFECSGIFFKIVTRIS